MKLFTRNTLSTKNSNPERQEVSFILIHVSSQKKGGVWFSIALNDEQKMVACSFSDRSKNVSEKALSNYIPRGERQTKIGKTIGRERFQELYSIFAGKKNAVSSSLDLSSVSEFRWKVYQILNRVPRGKVTTYGAIARRLGSRRYSRAVGGAIAGNPLPLVIPCHRVVLASHKVGNYGLAGRKPSEGGYVKRALLEREGVRFQGDKVSEESLWQPN
jgi:methylated-DNA-[protein]-cysteine S-methyltransferase